MLLRAASALLVLSVAACSRPTPSAVDAAPPPFVGRTYPDWTSGYFPPGTLSDAGSDYVTYLSDMHEPSLRDAMVRGVRAIRFLFDGTAVRVEVSGGDVWMTVRRVERGSLPIDRRRLLDAREWSRIEQAMSHVWEHPAGGSHPSPRSPPGFDGPRISMWTLEETRDGWYEVESIPNPFWPDDYAFYAACKTVANVGGVYPE